MIFAFAILFSLPLILGGLNAAIQTLTTVSDTNQCTVIVALLGDQLLLRPGLEGRAALHTNFGAGLVSGSAPHPRNWG